MSSPDRRRTVWIRIALFVAGAIACLAFELQRTRVHAQSGIGPPGLRWSAGPKKLIPPRQNPPPP